MKCYEAKKDGKSSTEENTEKKHCELVSVCDVRGLPGDSEGLVGDFGSTVGDRELVFAEEGVAFPSKDGVIAETAEDGVTERQEKHLQHKQRQ